MSDKKTGKTEQVVGAAAMCKFKGCKQTPSKFSFCKEHFAQFKFGLVTKNGELVSDHEKKWDQYTEYKKAA